MTQNIDGLHDRAGSGLKTPLIELHGNIFRTRCFEQNHPVAEWQENGETPPRCPQCGGQLRPDVVWFGEILPEGALEKCWAAALDCEIFFSIGTSGLVQPAAAIPLVAQQAGATLIEINPNETALSESADILIKGPAGLVLPRLIKAAWG
jgi:NAD-dependent deacetylase